MQLTISRLRALLVGAVIVLLAAIAMFLGYSRYARRHLGPADLPARLGAHIQQSANGFTYSQSRQGHTLFTLHAAKLIQLKEGNRSQLNDVRIDLFDANGHKTDSIYGKEFEYDPASGVAKADGEVRIELTPVQSGSGDASAPAKGPASTLMGHGEKLEMTTSGLVFNQKTGIASTDELVSFHFPSATGSAKGASYNSTEGTLALTSDFVVDTTNAGAPTRIRAGSAQFSRRSRQCFLLNAAVDVRQEHSTADEAIVRFREDGSAENIQASGHVVLASDSGQKLSAPRANVDLDGANEPKHAYMSSGVLFDSRDDVHRIQGSSAELYLDFSARTQPRHAHLEGNIALVDQQTGLKSMNQGSITREIRGGQADVDFLPDAQGRAEISKVLVQQEATLKLHTLRADVHSQNMSLSGDSLLAEFSPGMAMKHLTGNGHTVLADMTDDGVMQRSTGDTLNVSFDPAAVEAKPTGSSSKKTRTAQAESASVDKNYVSPIGALKLSPEQVRIHTAIQQGNVTIEKQPPRDPRDPLTIPPPSFKATADRGTYDGATQRMRLEGDPRAGTPGLSLTAVTIDYMRSTGGAWANGDVHATYLPVADSGSNIKSVNLGGTGPVHAVADAAELKPGTGDAVFTGKARLWQGSNSVSAPVIILSRAQEQLHASSQGSTLATAALLANAPGAPAATAAQQGAGHVVQLASKDIVYSDNQRKVTLAGSVTAVSGSMTIHADNAEIYLSPDHSKNRGDSQVDKMLVKGHVVVTEPGRRAVGEKLVYTSSDSRLVLTGTGQAPPRLTDRQHGSISGETLIFNTKDDSVNVEGGSRPTTIETHVAR